MREFYPFLTASNSLHQRNEGVSGRPRAAAGARRLGTLEQERTK